MLRRDVLSGALVVTLGLAPACARAHAKTTPESPPLDMPAPPPHDVEPIETEAPPAVQSPEEPARRAPARPRPTPPREQPRENRPEPPKPETATEPPKPTEEPSRPPTTLQTTPTTAEERVERAIRATLTRATSDLNRVDYRALNADGRTQYDQAKRLIGQADEAIRGKNLVYARSLADKAAGIAAQLAGR